MALSARCALLLLLILVAKTEGRLSPLTLVRRRQCDIQDSSLAAGVWALTRSINRAARPVRSRVSTCEARDTSNRVHTNAFKAASASAATLDDLIGRVNAFLTGAVESRRRHPTHGGIPLAVLLPFFFRFLNSTCL